MIGQYLSNKNESATVSKSKNFLDCLVHPEIQKDFKIFRHIESCGTCMKH